MIVGKINYVHLFLSVCKKLVFMNGDEVNVKSKRGINFQIKEESVKLTRWGDNPKEIKFTDLSRKCKWNKYSLMISSPMNSLKVYHYISFPDIITFYIVILV